MGSLHGSQPPDATDELQVIPRLPPPSLSAPALQPQSNAPGPRTSPAGGTTTRLLIRARRAKLSRIVVAAVAAGGDIRVAAGVAHLARANSRDVATTAAQTPLTTSPPTAAPIAVAPPAPIDAPTTGTLRIQRPALPGHVWLDGNKLATPTAAVPCGAHHARVAPRGQAHAVN